MLSLTHAQPAQTAMNYTSAHTKALSPLGSSGGGLNRSSQYKLEGLHTFVKAGLSQYWVWAVVLLPFTRRLEGCISENFHSLPGIIQEGKMRTLSRYKLAQLVAGCRIQISKLMRTNAKKWSVSVALRQNIIGISQINQASMLQQDISSLQISRLWITTHVFKKYSKQGT